MIRNATDRDFAELIRLGMAMHEESRYARFDFDAGKLERLFVIALDRGFLKVYEGADGMLAGGMLAMSSEMWFGRDLQTFDLALFIEPGKRGGVAAVRLTRAYVEWAQTIGAKEIGIGTTTGVNPEMSGRLFESLGFERVGAVYRMGA